MTVQFEQLKSVVIDNIRTIKPTTVEIVTSDKDFAQIHASEKDLKKLTIDADNDSLTIGAHIFAQLDQLEIIIHASNIENIQLNGYINFQCQKTAPRCKITCAGSVNSHLPLGKMDELVLTLAGSAEVDLNASLASMKLTIAGSGRVVLEGCAYDATFRTGGSAKVNGENFAVENLKIISSGSAKYYVCASKTLQMSINGSGSVEYSGNPELKNCNFGGSVNVTKL